VKVTGEEYIRMMELIKRVTVLEVLLLAIRVDMHRIGRFPLKLGEGWRHLMRWSEEKTEGLLREARKELAAMGAKIVSVNQTGSHREVTVRWRGFIYREKWLNPWLKAESHLCLQKLWE
jgi:hypothetical protein